MRLSWLLNSSFFVPSTETVCHFRVTTRYLIHARASIAPSIPCREGTSTEHTVLFSCILVVVIALGNSSITGTHQVSFWGWGSHQDERAPLVQV